MQEFRKNIYRINNSGSPPGCLNRFLLEVSIFSTFPNTVTLSYQDINGILTQQTWVANGSGEQVFHTFGVGMCIIENSLSIEDGTIINATWTDSINCCL